MFAPGKRVRLRALAAKPHLNGKEGVCKERKADTGRWLVRLDDGTEFAFKEANLQDADPAANVAEGCDHIMAQVEPRGQSVCDAMVYCLDNAADYAEVLAKRLVLAFSRPKVATEKTMARLFVISDVLSNCRGNRQGSFQFRKGFQELLPEACEKLGRLWVLQTESADDWVRREEAVGRVFKAWEGWRVFPVLFVKGLTALLFAPVAEISAREASVEADEILRQKLARWFSGLEQSSLPHESQLRGLAGKGLAPSSCRARLCHFERYWHLQPGVPVRLFGLQAAPHLNGLQGVCERWDWTGGRWRVRMQSGGFKSVKAENLHAEVSPTLSPVEPRGAANAPRAKAEPDQDPLDGEPLTVEELHAALAAEAKAAKEKKEARQEDKIWQSCLRVQRWSTFSVVD